MTEPGRRSRPDTTVSSAVEVAVDPDTAFAAFTSELDLWWVRGPINHLRGRPGPGDAVRAGRGRPAARGVRRRGRRRAGAGPDHGVGTGQAAGLAEFRRRREHRHQLRTGRGRLPGAGAGSHPGRRPGPGRHVLGAGDAQVVRAVVRTAGQRAPRGARPGPAGAGRFLRRPAAAARWLADAFGFTSPDPLPEGADPLPETSHGHPWIEFRLGNSSLMIFKLEAEPQPHPPTHVPWVYVDDIAGHYERARTGRGDDRDRTGQPVGAAVLRRRRPRGPPVDVRPGAYRR